MQANLSEANLSEVNLSEASLPELQSTGRLERYEIDQVEWRAVVYFWHAWGVTGKEHMNENNDNDDEDNDDELQCYQKWSS